ncbi:MAG: oxygen-independent coproporphyrinogen III oxidase [Filimonas sp.]|nr:oxygen-independent coproporphyrinogen III oxidase [Filimonas sp.]
MQPDNALLSKYNVPVPRYTSYPTVPFWKEGIDVDTVKQHFIQAFEKYNSSDGISIYIHLPFCESLCTYCGCMKKISSNHDIELPYIQAVMKEWDMYLQLIPEKPIIKELHLGGGTPTYFSPEHLAMLLDHIINTSTIHHAHSFSIEGHPNNTTEKHLEVLHSRGFKRISFGVQDNDAHVQEVINRIQPFANVQHATEAARKIGFTSVNFDLIYGLPYQTQESIAETVAKCLTLKPDRIAFYSYAHVPWTSKSQRLFDETNLPSAEEKLQLYQTGKAIFLSNGYHDIGMDHFSLPTDDLFIAATEKKLFRSFMGYSSERASLMIGLGVSSISDVNSAFYQNEKKLSDYYAFINNGQFSIQKGYFLSEEDRDFRKYILDLSCNGQTIFEKRNLPILRKHVFPALEALASDNLIRWNEDGISITAIGKNFIRNICSAFDLHLLHNKETLSQKPVYSKAI